MRIKIGDQWFEATANTPIMIELDYHDKHNIRMMPGNRYAVFHEDTPLTLEQRRVWMNQGAFIPFDEIEQETKP